MSLLVYGINHHTAPIGIREKLVFDETQLPNALQNLIAHNTVNEAVILSTCNRTEIYTDTTQTHIILEWLMQEKLFGSGNLSQYCYQLDDIHAVRHMMRVASGLDSMILGEPQILGQMKQAYFIAQHAGAVGTLLSQVFPAIFFASKLVRTETDIGAHPVTLAYAITQLSKKIYTQPENQRILFIGAGETIELIAQYFYNLGVKNITIANRTLEKSERIAKTVGAKSIRIQDIPAQLKETDIVISATASQLPLIGKGLIESTLRQRQTPLLLIDLAVPRDIEPEVAALNHVHLYNIDDLQKILGDNLNNRQEAAKRAEIMIEAEANQFHRKMRVFHARHVITEYRDRLEKIRQIEQEKALRQLQQGHNPSLVLEQFGHHLINKIMHHPTIKLREAASEEQCDLFQNIKAFFELE
ncbi:MAG: glutamyl-tRNA reductase [Gammaproteobacteria bacterium CG_4_10_14_0_8_um_filter_38_16]|nr:MAG: glutamyl-tRNA reductase [Gammaproteobacteria bacterium CG_4_10_14_0_8_um_filter_38_16]PJA03920.1 MAG: glutamyl-tRNA reductase [Gammaproteobacteria bacterium CG_4_10_14_0_2_um_filter_38_22]PJB09752.1 MAG: glutamyl-tRNA reductase [Gammaproteobacteria bacterium CG_4_9_14_3_um_filter_38_9]